MTAPNSASPSSVVHLPPAVEALLCSLVVTQRTCSSSCPSAFTVTGYHNNRISIWGGADVSPIDATRDQIDMLIAQGYLEWVVPPMMMRRLEVTFAGRCYVEALHPTPVVGVSTNQHAPA